MNRTFFILLLFSSLIFKSSYGQQFSIESFDIFWESMAQIENQEETTVEDLNRLWSSPGYSSWMSSKRGQGIFHNYYTLVYNPNLQDSLKSELEKAEGYRVTLFQHMIEAKEKEEDLLEFAKNLIDSDIIEQAKKNAFKYLPDTLSVENDSTVVALMIFQPDAFAVPDENVVLFDVLFANNYGQGIEKFLGHELFHIYAGKYLSKLKPTDYEEDALIWSIDKARNEGIADLIDKEDIFDRADMSEYDLEYIDHYNNSKLHLQVIDSLIQEIAKDHSKLKDLGKKVRREMPFGAHPIGLYIAKIIKSKMGKKTLLQCLESPFPFLYYYNEIAKESDGEYYDLSDESIQYLKILEQKAVYNKN